MQSMNLVTLTYNNNGSMTTDDLGRTLVYDAWNRLVSVTSELMQIDYEYDGLNRRNVTTRDLYYSCAFAEPHLQFVA